MEAHPYSKVDFKSRHLILAGNVLIHTHLFTPHLTNSYPIMLGGELGNFREVYLSQPELDWQGV